MAQRSPQQGGEGLSLQTLAIAALAAGCAAVLTSYFWQRGTLISAAMTPVIVAVVSEVLKRPATTMRRAARTARTATPARRERSRQRVPLAHGAGAGSPAEGPSRELPAPREPTVPMSSYKVYRSEGAARPRFGRIHWKIVLATAGAAFVIAVGALTLPELLFGSSVSGSQSTTLFGGRVAVALHVDEGQDQDRRAEDDDRQAEDDDVRSAEDDDERQDRHGADAAVHADAVDAVAVAVPGAAAVRTTVVAVDDATPRRSSSRRRDQQQQAPAPTG